MTVSDHAMQLGITSYSVSRVRLTVREMQKITDQLVHLRRVSGNLCTARGDWALDPEDLSQTTESQSRP